MPEYKTPQIPEPPKLLYKYRSLKNFGHIEEIFSGKLYFSSPEQFNDPIDSVMPLNFNLKKDEFSKWSRDKIIGNNRKDKRKNKAKGFKIMKKLNPQTIAQELTAKEYGVFSLSANNTDWLMWSYYADGHKGIAIGFNTDDSNETYFPIIYTKTLPNIKFSDCDNHIITLLTTKPNIYSHEEEYRIIKHKQPIGNIQCPSIRIAEIILGCKISAEDREKLISIISALPVKPRILETLLPKKPGENFELKLKEINL